MSRPREKWWGYVKACIREYPALYQELESARTGEANSGPPRPTEWEALFRFGENAPSDGAVFHGQRGREFRGVRNAVMETASLTDGPAILKMIELVFWKRSHTLSGAALICHVSLRTARRWHGDFIRRTADYMGLAD